MNSIWKPDFISTYFPTVDELTVEQLQAARANLETWLRAGWPDEDMQPGSVVGDRVLTPFSYLLAALETSAGRFMSDLDTSQVAQNIVFNCDFVTAFLQNFAVQDSGATYSTGILRMLFAKDSEINLNRQLQFSINNEIFTLDLPYLGELWLQPVGSVARVGQNHVIFRDLGNSVYSADVRVKGAVIITPVLVNTSATADSDITNLIGISALTDFDMGNAETSLATLAKKTRQTFAAASLTSRKSSVSAVLNLFPNLIGVSPILPGDDIMMRASVNALGITVPRVDIHVKSKQYDFLSSVTVNIPFVTTQGSPATSVRKFIAKLALPGYPTFIKSITPVENTAVVITPGVTANAFVWSKSLNPGRAPLLTCAGTAEEALWVSFDMPIHPITGSELITTAVTTDGVRYAQFVISYYHDPVYPGVSDQLDNPDTKPANAEVLTRPFIPVAINKFHITYTKQIGKVVNIAGARSEILSYLRGLSFPNRYSNAKIADALYYRNAEDVKSISVSATVMWSAATKVLPIGSSTPEISYVASLASAVTPPVVYITNTQNLDMVPYTDPFLGGAGETMAAASAANICYIIAENNITFSEELIA